MFKARQPELVTLATSAFIVFVLNIPFWQRLFAAVAPKTPADWLFICASAAALLLLTNLVLTAIANRAVFRWVMAIVLPLTAAAAYFMHEYGVVIDANMVRNIFETNPAEARDLVSPKMAAAIALLGFLPAIVIWQTPWPTRSLRENVRTKIMIVAISIPLIIAFAFPFWGAFLSTFREHRELRMTLTPSNYIAALSKYLRSTSANNAVATFGEDARRVEPAAARDRKSLFVIVIGETARADHFALNGYARPTTPELEKISGLINYPQAYSCGTDTAQSVPCMFSGLGRSKFSNARASARENLLDILKRAGLDVIWRENQAGCKGVCLRIPTEDLTVNAHAVFNYHNENGDEILIDGLPERLASLRRDTVIVMHMMGSHGPAYWKRYPDRFELFKPTCKESQFSRCKNAEIVNSYDNTIVYTDYVLGQLIRLLEGAAAQNVDAGMLYMSDHGESLGENNLYLHGMPYGFAPEAQIHVPMVMWLSPAFSERAGIDRACLNNRSASKTSHDALFHSILGVMDVATTVYDPGLDLFAPCRQRQSTMR